MRTEDNIRRISEKWVMGMDDGWNWFRILSNRRFWNLRALLPDG